MAESDPSRRLDLHRHLETFTEPARVRLLGRGHAIRALAPAIRYVIGVDHE